MIKKYIFSAFKGEVSPGKLALMLIPIKVALPLFFMTIMFAAASPSVDNQMTLVITAYLAMLIYVVLAFLAPYLVYRNINNAGSKVVKFALCFLIVIWLFVAIGVYNAISAMVIGAG